MPPLRQRSLEDLPLRNDSPKTQKLSVECGSLSARHCGTSPALLGPEDLRASQLSLVHEKQASWSRLNQTFCARRFLSRITLGQDWAITHIPFPRKEQTLPVVLSLAEVRQCLAAIPHTAHPAARFLEDGSALQLALSGDVSRESSGLQHPR